MLHALSALRSRLSCLPGGEKLGLLRWAPREELGSGCAPTHVLRVCADRPSQTHKHRGPPTGIKTPPGISVRPCSWQRRVYTVHMHTCRARICTRSHARPRAQAHTRRPIATQTHPGPGGRGSLVPCPPTHPPPAAGPFFCNSCIYFTVLSIGRGFQNTLGLFTELCKNILSPLQLSLPEGSGTCPSLHWASCAPCQQQPQLLKGPAGLTLRVGRWGLGEGPAGQRLVAPAPPPRLLAPNTRSLLTGSVESLESGKQATSGVKEPPPSRQTIERPAVTMGPNLALLLVTQTGERPAVQALRTPLLPETRLEQ